MPDTKTDMYGRLITRTASDSIETYSDGVSVFLELPVGSGWQRAMNIIEAHAPEGWTPPEAP